jgi:hypothetical protein
MTPFSAWEAINKYIPKDKTIWEPFYGDGMSKKHLLKLGCKKVIHKNKDFFTYTPKYDIIISNPPFSISKKVVNRLRELDKPFIIIMPAPKINTSYFRENFKDTGKLQIIIPRKRIQFIKLVNGKVVDMKKNNCSFDCFYYCYKMNLKNDITWLE